MSWQTDPAILVAATAAQTALLNPHHHVWVAAHAGTGKTETLTRRIITLLLSDETLLPENILALTYTKAAAGEMKVRLPRLAAKWAALPEEKQIAQLTELLGTAPTPAQLARLQALPALLATSPLWSNTIHGLASELLQRFPTEAGVPVGFSVLEDGTDQNNLLRQAQQQVLKQAETDAQLQTFLTQLVEELGDHKVSTLIELVVSDWDKLQQVLAHNSTLSGGFSGQLAGLLEATEAPTRHPDISLLRQWQSLLLQGGATSQKQAEKLTSLLANPYSLTLWEDLFFTGNSPRAKWLAGDNATIEAITTAGLAASLEDLKTDTILWLTAHRAARAYTITHALLIWVTYVSNAYQALKVAQGLLDFADLIHAARNLLAGEKATEKAWVLYRLDRDIKHLLLDEAQDNNSAQNAIFRALAEELVKEEGATHPRTVLAVGDLKQSILRFQGAAPATFVSIQSWLMQAAPQRTTSGTLAHSFRSASHILQLADATWHKGNPVTDPHQTVRPAATGFVQLHHVPVAEKDTNKPETWLTAQQRQLATVPDTIGPALVAAIQNIVGRLPLASTGGPARYQDILVLVKSNATGAELTGRLRAAGIPTRFMAKPRAMPLPLSVQDYLALAQAALNPTNTFALGHVLASPLVGWPLARVTAWLQQQQDLPPDVQAWLATQKHTLLTQGKAAWLAQRLAEQHPAVEDTTPHSLAALMLSAQASDAAGEDVPTWIEKLNENKLPSIAQAAADAVRVMTVHGAKGLEAPLVILPEATFAMGRSAHADPLMWQEDPATGNLTGVLYVRSAATPPAYQQQLQQAEDAALLQDHERLLYVAITRAKEGLVVLAEQKPEPKTPSKKEPTPTWAARIETALRQLGATASEHLLTYGPVPALQAAPPSKPVLSPPPVTNPRPYHQPPTTNYQHSPEQTHGTQVHALLALLPRQPREQWARTATLLGSTPKALTEATNTLEAFPQFFTPDALAEHEITLPNGTSGRLDRLVITPECVTLVDFKTDAVLPTTPPPAYATQLQTYLQALQPHFTQPVKAVLVFTAHGALLPVPRA